MTKHFRSRYPHYPDDSDYTTNAPSYYDDLARKNTLIQKLAEKIWEYEEALKISFEEIETVLTELLDKIGEGFNDEIADLLVQWIDDGTLDHIINETLMNKKADKTELQALETALNEAMTLLETTLTTQMNEFKQTTNNKITKAETDTTVAIEKNKNELTSEIKANKKMLDDKIDHIFKDRNLTQYNFQKRLEENKQSHVSLQGSCFIGGKGENIEYALAFLPLDGNPNNEGTVLTTKGNQMIQEKGGNKLKLYHANGMDYNPETNSIFVSHANEQISNGNQTNNDVTELTRDGQTIKRVITPKGIPENRRVKYYSYDKVTKKKYLGDDYGIYEVDNNLNVLNVIDFSDRFREYKKWGLGQTAVIHNNYIFYLTMGPATIAVFDLTGKLLTLFELPKFTKEGVFVGSEPQSLFFDNEDNLYLASRSEYSSFNLADYITRIFKMSPFTGTSSNNFVGTHNTRTANDIYVDSNSTSPIQNGSSSYPFHTLDEAITYVLTSDYQKGFQTNINLKNGHYYRTNVHSNGAKLNIIGEDIDGVQIDELIFFNTDVKLTKITLNNPEHIYALKGDQSTILMNGVKIDAKDKGNGVYIEQGSTLFANNAQGNEIKNCDTAIYANSSLVIGNKTAFGITNHPNPIKTSLSGYAPMLETKEEQDA